MKRKNRLFYYEQMLLEIDNRAQYNQELSRIASQINFCSLLISINYKFGNTTKFKDLYELCKYKPKQGWEKNKFFWFEPHDKIRVEILKKIIARIKLPWYKRILIKTK